MQGNWKVATLPSCSWQIGDSLLRDAQWEEKVDSASQRHYGRKLTNKQLSILYSRMKFIHLEKINTLLISLEGTNNYRSCRTEHYFAGTQQSCDDLDVQLDTCVLMMARASLVIRRQKSLKAHFQ